MGEHAAVYGRPALVAAVDRRLTVELRLRSGDGVRLELPQVGVAETVQWAELARYTRTCRQAWETYRDRPGPETFRGLRGEDPAHLVKVALGEAAAALGEEEGPTCTLSLASEIPIGAGFGSSAATAAAVVRAYLELRGASPSPAELRRITLEVERRQHGAPSGVDNATVLHGGLVWAQRDAAGQLQATPLAARPPILERVRVFNTGTPAESTGEVVAAVRSRKDADPEEVGRLLERMESATRALRAALEGSAGPARVVELFRGFEACLEGLGVVPAAVREIVREVESRGGAAKISGAGSVSGPGAGSLLVVHPDPGAVESWDFLSGLEPLDLRLGAPGVRIEPSATDSPEAVEAG